MSLIAPFPSGSIRPAIIVLDPDRGDWSALTAVGLPVFDPGTDPAPLRFPNVAPVHLIGRGAGAASAFDAARRQPGAVASLTLVDPHALQLLRHVPPALSRGMRIDALRRTGFPLFFVETGTATTEVVMVTRRLHMAARRGTYRVADAGMAGAVCAHILSTLARRPTVQPAPPLAQAA